MITQKAGEEIKTKDWVRTQIQRRGDYTANVTVTPVTDLKVKKVWAITHLFSAFWWHFILQFSPFQHQLLVEMSSYGTRFTNLDRRRSRLVVNTVWWWFTFSSRWGQHWAWTTTVMILLLSSSSSSEADFLLSLKSISGFGLALKRKKSPVS